MRRTLFAILFCALPVSRAAMAQSAELPTPWVTPPGDPLDHEAAGFAKVLCSAVFITGRPVRAAAEEDGYFVAPYAMRRQVVDTVVDRARRLVRVRLANGIERIARQVGDQGCVILPRGVDSVAFRPVAVTPLPANGAALEWPMGEDITSIAPPPGIDLSRVQAAVDSMFAPDSALTAAVVVLYRGQLIAERYRAGITDTTRLPGWSMGKSVTATMIGRLIQQGAVGLWDAAPVNEWRALGDVRSTIRVADLLRMSSGLRFVAPQDPGFDPKRGYPDHLYVYTGATDAQRYALTRPPQWAPNTVGRYRNTDPLVLNAIVRGLVTARGEEYLTWPQRALFNQIGVRHMTLETDLSGGFLLQGFEHASARDWARIGLLTLQDGKWMGAQLLPVGWLDFVRTPAPAWPSGEYGGMFWLNRPGEYPVPRDAFYMAGVGGQFTFMLPTHDLVVARLGHYKGAAAGEAALKRGLAMLVQAVPQVRAVWEPPK
jgi:CubicO group peptidase (beta-lactamase class C family)